VYAVEFSHRSGRDLLNVAKKRTNIIPIIEDARHPHKYRMLVGMVDVVFADVAQPDQARIVSLNSSYFLKTGAFFVISIKVSIHFLQHVFSLLLNMISITLTFIHSLNFYPTAKNKKYDFFSSATAQYSLPKLKPYWFDLMYSRRTALTLRLSQRPSLLEKSRNCRKITLSLKNS